MNPRSSSLFLADQRATRLGTKQSAALRAASLKLASAFLALSGLASSAYAQATWVGGTSQDWNTAANWNIPTPSGNFIINTATPGVFPIITGASAFAPVDIFIGSVAGQVGRLDLNAATVGTGPNNTGATNWLLMGVNGGTGTLNIGAGSTFLGRVHMLRTTVSSTATINVSGTLTSPGEIVISDGQNNQPTVQGTMNVNTGGVVNSEGDLIIAWAGNSSTFGELNIAAGATVTVASTFERWLIMNQWDGVQGRLNINGGTLNLNANTDIRFNPGNCVGAGTLTLNGGAIVGGATSVIDLDTAVNNAAVNNTLNLNGGTVTIGQILSGVAAGTRTINFNGATLRAAAADPVANSTVVPPIVASLFIPANAASVANVKVGGAIIDSNTFNITVAKALTADAVSTGGGLTKLGTGVLTLSGVNTYTGNTTVTDGGLTLADNGSIKFVIGANGVNSQLTGISTGAITLDGDFAFDLTAASTTLGHSWQIVDAALTETFGPTFTVTGFTLTAGKWIKPANGAFYEFDTATGVLSVISDPAIVFPPPTVTPAANRASYPIGSDFTLSVTASGTGTLTYQWYYQADSGDSLHLLSGPGATSASYPITSATAGSGGIYTVVVTDSAAATTPTTVTFPVISVLPGTDFTVAYYRFEDGVADAFITSTMDSVAGGAPLTALGTPNYAADSLPYAKVPRTGANDTLGANFPAIGNQGLIASTTGTLASTTFLDFTIEAFVRLDSLAGWQTIVGRDDTAAPGEGTGLQSLFYLSKSANNNGFRVEVINSNNTNLQVNSTFVPTVGTWYHVAAVGNVAAGTLTLYVNGNSVGATTGFSGLFVPSVGSDTPWTLGRGDYNAIDGDILRGDLDEVRFSSAALPPSQFLASTDAGTVIPPVVTQSPASQTLHDGDSTTLSVTATGTSTTLTYEWYRNDVLISGQTGTTLTLSNVTAANEGTYRAKVIDPISTTLGVDISTTTVPAVIRVLTVSSTARSLGLNFVGTSGGGGWSTVIGSLAPTSSAGFAAAMNWNNSAVGVASQGTPVTLLEKSGALPAYTTATWDSALTWAARTGTGDPTTGQKTPDTTLLHGYIESRAATGATVSLANIPYGTYDVYVYVAGGGNGNIGSVTTDHAGSATYYYKILQHDGYVPATAPTSGSPYTLPFVIGEATSAAAAQTAPAATFVRFTGMTGADLTISAMDAVLNANAGGIAGVQIVDTTPAGVAYPPTVTSTSGHQLVEGGANVLLSVTAVPGNSGGTLAYQWSLGGSPISGATSASLPLASVSSAVSGSYTVAITETSDLGVVTITRALDLTVLDASRSVLINGDIGTSAASSMTYTGVLLTDGSVSIANVGTVASPWNNLATAVGSATRAISRESTGLSLPGLTFSYSGVDGSLDNIDPVLGAGIDDTNRPASGTPILRDLAYTDNQGTPLVGTVGGLSAFAGKRVKLVVYAVGVNSTFGGVATFNDAATVTLAPANNYLGTAPIATDNAMGRYLPDNPLAYATFDAVVSPEGTVSWSLGSDVDFGRIPLNGFQLLITDEDLAPPAPTSLAASASGAAINLTWNAAAGATSYTIKRGTVSGGPYSNISAGAVVGTSYSDTNVTADATYYYVVAAANAVASSGHSNQASATASSALSALQTWRQANFGSPANSGNAADTFDADFDGLPNLLEYALGTNPNAPQAGPVVTVSRAGDHLKLDFNHIGDASLVYSIEGTNELTGTWSTVHTFPAFGTAGTASYTDTTVSLLTQPRRFLRLRVTTTL